jgi:hypothetical protein
MISRIAQWFSVHINAADNKVALDAARAEIESLRHKDSVANGYALASMRYVECLLDQMKLIRSNNASLREALSKPENPPSPHRYTLADLRDEIEALKKTAPRHTAESIKTPAYARNDTKKRPTKKKK